MRLTKRLKIIVGTYFVTSVKIGELNYFLMIYSNYFMDTMYIIGEI